MNIYSQIFYLFLITTFYFIYRHIKKKKKKTSNIKTLTEEEMRTYLIDFDFQKEERVRKQWFISFVVFSFASAFSVLCAFLTEGAFSELSKSTSFPFSLLIGTLVSFLVMIPWFWITYHCSYKKKGSAWLMWTMIVLPIKELADIGKGEWNNLSEWAALDWFLVVIFLGIEIFYWINCRKLYKINSCREYRKAQALKAKYGPDESGF